MNKVRIIRDTPKEVMDYTIDNPAELGRWFIAELLAEVIGSPRVNRNVGGIE